MQAYPFGGAKPDVMTKLVDLSEQELADLLSLSLSKARKWLEVAKKISEGNEPPGFEGFFGDLESSTILRRSSVKELMVLSVEEVEQLKRTGEFYRRFPYFKRKMPTDTQTQLRYLRELLSDEVEFEARYPAAYEVLFRNTTAISGVLLPSFGVRILRSDPETCVLPAGCYQEWKTSQDTGDAFSITFERRAVGDNEVDQKFAPLDLGYVRGVLLAILSREEYAERIATELHSESVREKLRAPAQSPVRITDLRLASALKQESKGPDPMAPKILKKALQPLLSSLERPLTLHRILQWKWNLLHNDEEAMLQPRAPRSEDEEIKIVRVSFAAAALLLFLDFDMPDIRDEDVSVYRLAGQISELADYVQKLSKSLNANANKLKKLLAYRDPNRPSTLGQEFYEALVAYRMGEEFGSIAKSLGITPYKSSPSEWGGDFGGTKHWKKSLEEKLRRGTEIEREKYPLAATVFKNQHKPRVDARARLAYRSYLVGVERYTDTEEDLAPWFHVGERINVEASTDWGMEIIKAYVQLGSCLEREIEPFPTHSDFDS